MAEFIAYRNGKFLPESQISLSCMDRGFLYGDGVFETMRSTQAGVLAFYDHYERFKDGADRLRIPMPLRPIDLRSAIRDLLMQNNLIDATIRCTLTRGLTDSFGFGFSQSARPTLVLAARPARKLPDDIYRKGVAVELQTADWIHDGIKSTSSQSYVMAKQLALDKGSYDTLLVRSDDIVMEGTSSNVFIIQKGTVRTPPLSDGILPGITRKRVIELLNDRMSIPFAETAFTKSELLSADEVFLTNTNVDVLPVTRIAGQKISDVIGEITSKIQMHFRQTLVEIAQ